MPVVAPCGFPSSNGAASVAQPTRCLAPGTTPGLAQTVGKEAPCCPPQHGALMLLGGQSWAYLFLNTGKTKRNTIERVSATPTSISARTSCSPVSGSASFNACMVRSATAMASRSGGVLGGSTFFRYTTTFLLLHIFWHATAQSVPDEIVECAMKAAPYICFHIDLPPIVLMNMANTCIVVSRSWGVGSVVTHRSKVSRASTSGGVHAPHCQTRYRRKSRLHRQLICEDHLLPLPRYSRERYQSGSTACGPVRLEPSVPSSLLGERLCGSCRELPPIS